MFCSNGQIITVTGTEWTTLNVIDDEEEWV